MVNSPSALISSSHLISCKNDDERDTHFKNCWSFFVDHTVGKHCIIAHAQKLANKRKNDVYPTCGTQEKHLPHCERPPSSQRQAEMQGLDDSLNQSTLVGYHRDSYIYYYLACTRAKLRVCPLRVPKVCIACPGALPKKKYGKAWRSTVRHNRLPRLEH